MTRKTAAPRDDGLLPSKPFRYQLLVDEIEEKITNGTYKVGDRLPSIRKLHQQISLSISTVYKAYTELEAMGLVEARPKSGYYVSSGVLGGLKPPTFEKQSPVPRQVSLSGFVSSILSAMNDPGILPFGSSSIAPDLLPYRAISRVLKRFNPNEIKDLLRYSVAEGEPELRRYLAQRMTGWAQGIPAEDIIITNGCNEALTLALMATVRPGDTIAVETPTHFGLLQLLKELNVMVVEVPTDPKYGLDLGELEKVLKRTPIRACVVIPNFHNPLGYLMPDEAKKHLVHLLNQYEIPLIEDEIYAELHYGPHRPRPLNVFDQRELVITCGSFSKTLIPGFRIGWIIPGSRFMKRVKNLKVGMNVCTATLNQVVLARYLAGESYDRHLRMLRRRLKNQTFNIAGAIRTNFPRDTRLVLPQGGALLWVQLAKEVDSIRLYRRALAQGISILPGAACAMTGQFNNCIRIGCGHPMTEKMAAGIATLGQCVRDCQRR